MGWKMDLDFPEVNKEDDSNQMIVDKVDTPTMVVPENVEIVEREMGFPGLISAAETMPSSIKNAKRTTESPLSEIMDKKKTNTEDYNVDTLDSIV